jgi:acetyl-CoA acetyltransferase
MILTYRPVGCQKGKYMTFSKKVAILHGSRTPFVKSMTQYQGKSNQDLLSYALNNLVSKTKIEGKLLGDIIAGTVMNHPVDWNISREVVLGSKLHPNTPGLNIQRACGTGLEAANLIALKIASGQIDVGIAGGSLALGHPFAATGGRIVATAAKILKEKGQGRILISICTAGGMGIAAIIER